MDERNQIDEKLQRKRELTNARVKNYRKRKRMESQQLNFSLFHKTKNHQLNSSMQDDPNEEMESMQVQEKIAERKKALAKERSRRYRERKRALQSVHDSQIAGNRTQKNLRLELEGQGELERVIELSKVECGPPSIYVTHHTMEEEMQNIQNHYNEDYAENDKTTFENSMVNLEQMMDEDYNLCQFLYHEMKCLSSADIKRKLHLAVQKTLLEALRQDEVEKLDKMAV